MCCLWWFVSSLRNLYRLLLGFSWKESPIVIGWTSVDICISCHICFNCYAFQLNCMYLFRKGFFVIKFYFFTHILEFCLLITLYTLYPLYQIFPFTLIFRHLCVSIFILHIQLNHVAALDFSIFCFIFRQLWIILSFMAANSGYTQTSHSRLYKDIS